MFNPKILEEIIVFNNTMKNVNEIKELDKKIKELQMKRRVLKRFNSRRTPELDLLVAKITLTPGLNRKNIEDAFPRLKSNEITGLLTVARRNRGLIENRGTKSRPAWFLTGSEKS